MSRGSADGLRARLRALVPLDPESVPALKAELSAERDPARRARLLDLLGYEPGRWRETLREAAKSRADAAGWLADAETTRGRFAEAAAAARLWPRDAWCRFHAALALQGLGRRAAALAALAPLRRAAGAPGDAARLAGHLLDGADPAAALEAALRADAAPLLSRLAADFAREGRVAPAARAVRAMLSGPRGEHWRGVALELGREWSARDPQGGAALLAAVAAARPRDPVCAWRAAEAEAVAGREARAAAWRRRARAAARASRGPESSLVLAEAALLDEKPLLAARLARGAKGGANAAWAADLLERATPQAIAFTTPSLRERRADAAAWARFTALREAGRLREAAGHAREELVARADTPAKARSLAEVFESTMDWADAARAARSGARGGDADALRLYEAACWLKAGKPREALAAARAAEAARPPGADGDLTEFLASVISLRLDRAVEAAGRLLDSGDPAMVNRVLRPFQLEPLAFRRAPASYARRAYAACAALDRRRPGEPWGIVFRRAFSKWFGENLDHPDSEDDMSRLAEAARGRWPWLGEEAGLVCLPKRRFAEARAHFARAARHGSWLALGLEAEALTCAGRLPQALALLRGGKRRHPGHAAALDAWAGSLLLWAGRYARALPLLRAARARGARYADGWIGACLAALGQHERALAHLRSAVVISPRDLESSLWLAETLLRLDRAEEAAAELDRARPLYEQTRSVYYAALDALCRDALGDSSRLAAAWGEIAGSDLLKRYARRALPARARDARSLRRALRRFLADSKGVRRGGHEIAIWDP